MGGRSPRTRVAVENAGQRRPREFLAHCSTLKALFACVAGQPAGIACNCSATAPALLSTAVPDGCSRRRSTASIHGCVPPASVQSSCVVGIQAILGIACNCLEEERSITDRTHRALWSIAGVGQRCALTSSIASPATARQLLLRCSRRPFPTPFYRIHPWMRTSCIHAVVLRCRHTGHPWP